MERSLGAAFGSVLRERALKGRASPRRLQERLVQKYEAKQERRGRYPSVLEAIKATDEQKARVVPHLDYRACRATPVSFLRGQLRIQGLHKRLLDATEAIKYRSQNQQA